MENGYLDRREIAFFHPFSFPSYDRKNRKRGEKDARYSYRPMA